MKVLSRLKYSLMKVALSKKMKESYAVVAIVAGSGYAKSSWGLALGMFVISSVVWLLMSTLIFMLSDQGKKAFDSEQVELQPRRTIRPI